MTDLSSERGKSLVLEALSGNANITRNQVKDWIGNMKKKILGKKHIKIKQSNCSIRKRKKSARLMFQEDYLKRNCGKMEGLEAEWAKVADDPQAMAVYKQRAEEANSKEIVLTDKEQEIKALKIRKEMQKLANDLSNLGYECIGVIVKPNSNLCAQFGSPRGKKFLEKGNTYWEFLSHVNVEIKEHETSEWEDLRGLVQEKLNKAYQDSGMNTRRVEWSKVKQGTILVEGFPSGLQPAPASTFGKENLKKILDDSVIITFRDAETSNENQASLPAPSMSDPTYMEDPPFILNLGDQEEVRRLVGDAEVMHERAEGNAVDDDKEQNEATGDKADAVYEVESLLKKSVRQKTTHYLVKWQNFEVPTWEPHTNIPSWIKRAFNAKNSDHNGDMG